MNFEKKDKKETALHSVLLTLKLSEVTNNGKNKIPYSIMDVLCRQGFLDKNIILLNSNAIKKIIDTYIDSETVKNNFNGNLEDSLKTMLEVLENTGFIEFKTEIKSKEEKH